MHVCLWWLQPLPRTPCPPPALSQAARFLSRVGSLDAKPGMPVMRGGRGAATRRGHEGASGRPALFPGNTVGSELSGAVAWKDCSPGTRARAASPQETPPTSGGRSPRGRMGKLRLPGASESQGLSRTRTQDPDLEKALGSSCRYLDGCPASLRGWDTEAWAWWGGPSGTPSPCPPPRSSPRGVLSESQCPPLERGLVGHTLKRPAADGVGHGEEAAREGWSFCPVAPSSLLVQAL